MAFWDEKIVCEQCNKKTKKKTSIYRRGSRFCSEACVMAWEAANPPPVARGDEASLRKELVIVMDEAFAEAPLRADPARARLPEQCDGDRLAERQLVEPPASGLTM